MNLSERVEFIEACARDSRSFSRASFTHAMQVLGNNALLNHSESTILETFLTKVDMHGNYRLGRKYNVAG